MKKVFLALLVAGFMAACNNSGGSGNQDNSAVGDTGTPSDNTNMNDTGMRMDTMNRTDTSSRR